LVGLRRELRRGGILIRREPVGGILLVRKGGKGERGSKR